MSSTQNSITIKSSAANGQTGSVVAELANGVTLSKGFTASCAKGGDDGLGSYVSVYPNPAKDVLYVEIDVDFAQTMLRTDVKTALIFDVRLYDGQGNLLRQTKTKGGTVEFNVSNLPEGMYYLHVYDGVNQTPEMHQIVIQ